MTDRRRTFDVTSSSASFADLMLPDEVVGALFKAGYSKPSPVQQAALPLARLGTDMVVQAKSGTGKTVVFAACCIERVHADVARPQVGLHRRCTHSQTVPWCSRSALSVLMSWWSRL